MDERPSEEREENLLYNEAELESYRVVRDKLHQSIELNPYVPDAYVLLGNAYAEIDGDVDTMLKYYDHAISLDPDNDEFRNVRMAHHLSNGELDQALIELEHLERLQSKYAESMREHYEKERDGG